MAQAYRAFEGVWRSLVSEVKSRRRRAGSAREQAISSEASSRRSSRERRQDEHDDADGVRATPLELVICVPPRAKRKRCSSTLAGIPWHMMSSIFVYLPATDIRKVAWVSRGWRNVVARDVCLQRLMDSQGLYVVGGINQAVGYSSVTSVTLRSVVKCNPLTATDGTIDWHQARSMHDERYHCGSAVYDRRVYVFGGRNSEERLRSGECYDPISDAWQVLPPMKTVRSAPACAVHGRYIYVFGGFDGVREFRTVERFDPINNVWADSAALARMPSEACELGAVSVGQHIYIIGGTQCRHSPGEKVLPIVQRYSPDRNEWSFLPSMSTKRMCPAVVAYEGKLWVIGGSDGEGALSSVEYFDPDTMSWHDGAPMSTCRSNATATVIDGMIYVTGGFFFEEGGPLSSVERYEKGKGWVKTGWSLPEKRDACKVLALE